MKRILFIVMIALFLGCSPKVDLTFKESLMANDVKLTNSEKSDIVEYLSNYEFQYLKRDEFYYGGAYFVIDYEKEGKTHHWIVSGSAQECTVEEKNDEIYYVTYDSKVIEYLSEFIH